MCCNGIFMFLPAFGALLGFYRMAHCPNLFHYIGFLEIIKHMNKKARLRDKIVIPQPDFFAG